MSRLSPSRLVRRGLRHVPGVSILLALLVLVGAALVVGAPRLTTSSLTSELHHELLGSSGDTALSIQLYEQAGFGGDNIGDPIDSAWSKLPARLERIRHRIPELAPVLESGQFTGRAAGPTQKGYSGAGTPTTPRNSDAAMLFTLEAAPSLRDEARLTAGRWPSAPVAGKPIEVVMSAKTATTLGWEIGQTQLLDGAPDAHGGSAVLVGTVAPRDPLGTFWTIDANRAHAGTLAADDGTISAYLSTIWVDAASWPTLAPTLVSRSVQAWYGIDVSALTADRASAVQSDVRRFMTQPAGLHLRYADQSLAFRSGLPTKIEDFIDLSGPPTALIALFEVGPLGALVAVLLLGVRLLQARRSSAEALLRARGASGAQLRLIAAAEVAVWTVPAAILGAVTAVLVTLGQGSLSTAIVVGTVCALVAPVVAGALAGQPGARAPRSALVRAAGPVAEVAVVLIAALAVVVLLTRGPVTASSGVDPLVELAPLLLAVAVTVVVLRIVPFGTRWWVAVQRRGRGAVSLVAASGTGLTRRGGGWILFALVVGVGISVFSLTMVATQQHGVRQAALTQTGSDLAVSGPYLTAQSVRKLEALPGVAAHATVQTIGKDSLPDSNVDLYTVDPTEIAAVQHGIDDSLLASVRRGDALVGNVEDPPATATFDATGSTTLHLHPAASDVVSFVFTEPKWIVLDRAAVQERNLGPQTVGVILRLRDGADLASVAAAAAKEAGPGATVRTAAATEAQIVGTPLDGAVHLAILAATILSALLGLVVFIVTLAAGAAERLRRGAILRALGFDRRQAAALVFADVVPTAIIGVVAGALTGVGLAGVVIHALDPNEFIGAPIPVALIADVPTTALVLVGFLLVAVIAAAVAVTLDLARPATASLQTLGEEQ